MSSWGTFPRPAKGLAIVSPTQKSGWLLHHGLGLFIVAWTRIALDFVLHVLLRRRFELER